MIVTHIGLKNWRNFRTVDVALTERVFIVGPNASGKSNFLDVVKFLRDISKPGGGLQKAVEDRGGVSKIRCLAARKYPEIEISLHLSEAQNTGPMWKYEIGIKQEPRGFRLPIISYERAWKNGEKLLDRPDERDKSDPLLLTQTHLEQITANVKFREIARFFESISYMHLVPQLVRYPKAFSGPGLPDDPFGRNFLEQVAKTQERIRKPRLKKIEHVLRIAVPQLKELSFIQDNTGIPHLEAIYEHWRPLGAKQREDQFSDGTLRLLGLLWTLFDSDSLLLFEEPELSLNSGIVSRLASLIYRIQRQKKRQIMLSTHSFDLLSDKGIGGDEVLLLRPSMEGTTIEIASTKGDIVELLNSGLSIGEATLPYTSPNNVSQLELFE
ncbi:MAG: AAA family ATPase [Ignavibacteriae bacterium]|nr:AAA family ATPase [Ignavibacteriota bacterium]